MSLKHGKSGASPKECYLRPRTLTRLVHTEAFPSSEAFEAIDAALSSSESERKDAVNQGKAIFAFKLKNAQDQEEAWHIDLKETGKVGKGEAPAGKKADGELRFLQDHLQTEMRCWAKKVNG